MAKRFSVKPTLAGACSVVLWGCALPVVKVVEDQIGLLGFMGFAYAAMAVFGLGSYLIRRKQVARAVLREPVFYARWLCFVLHEGLLAVGVSLVQRRHMPELILINYLWPTAIIVCSVALGVVRILRWWAFLTGSAIVLVSMLAEAVGVHGVTAEVFARRSDCVAYLVVLIGAISWGMYSALSRRDGEVTGGSAVLPVFQATLGVALPVSFLPGLARWSGLRPGAIGLLLGYCFLLYLSYSAWDVGMRRGNVVLLSLFADVIPWLSLVATNVMLHVAVGGRVVASAAVLVVGAMIVRYGTSQAGVVPAAYEEPLI